MRIFARLHPQDIADMVHVLAGDHGIAIHDLRRRHKKMIHASAPYFLRAVMDTQSPW